MCMCVYVRVSNCINFYYAMRMLSTDYAVARCLSVCPSITCQYSVKTVTHILQLFSPLGSQTVLVFPCQMVC